MNGVFCTTALTLCVAAAFLCANPTQADTILDQPVVGGSGDVGQYDGAYWNLSDSGFALSGDPLAQSVALQSVAFKRSASSSGFTAGELYLKVFSGSAGGLGTFVGVSNNTVDFGSLASQAMGTWTFSSLALDKDTTYSYVVGTTNDSSNPSAKIPLQLSSGTTPLASAAQVLNDASADYGWAPCLHITAAPVPEPATMSLLATGLLGLIAYAWRKRR